MLERVFHKYTVSIVHIILGLVQVAGVVLRHPGGELIPRLTLPRLILNILLPIWLWPELYPWCVIGMAANILEQIIEAENNVPV